MLPLRGLLIGLATTGAHSVQIFRRFFQNKSLQHRH